jgi:hypothetical protein
MYAEQSRAMAQEVKRLECTPNRAVPWLRRLVGRTGFNPRLVRVGILVDNVALGTDFAPSTVFPRQYNSTSSPCSFTRLSPTCVNLAVYSVVQITRAYNSVRICSRAPFGFEK